MTGTGTHAKAKSVPARTGRAVALLGWAITYLDEPSDTGDAFMLYEQRTASGGVIPPHRENNHEAFHILEGTFEIDIEGETNRYRGRQLPRDPARPAALDPRCGARMGQDPDRRIAREPAPAVLRHARRAPRPSGGPAAGHRAARLRTDRRRRRSKRHSLPAARRTRRVTDHTSRQAVTLILEGSTARRPPDPTALAG